MAGYFVSPKDFVKNFTKFLQRIGCRDFIRTAMLQARIREWPLLTEVNAVSRCRSELFELQIFRK
jgi:hypothetical protein